MITQTITCVQGVGLGRKRPSVYECLLRLPAHPEAAMPLSAKTRPSRAGKRPTCQLPTIGPSSALRSRDRPPCLTRPAAPPTRYNMNMLNMSTMCDMLNMPNIYRASCSYFSQRVRRESKRGHIPSCNVNMLNMPNMLTMCDMLNIPNIYRAKLLVLLAASAPNIEKGLTWSRGN
jgi:hypothetical protein